MTRTVIIPARVHDVTGASETMCFTRDDKGNVVSFCKLDHVNGDGHYCTVGFMNTLSGVRAQECIDMEVKSE